MSIEKDLRERFVEKALSFVGAIENTVMHKYIIDTYNAIRPLPVNYTVRYSDPWCAAFVSAMGALSGLGNIILPECSCGRMVSLYKEAGGWIEDDAYIPQLGDILMYGWSDSGNGDYTGPPDHVGIVNDCDGKTMHVIEGNYRNSVGIRTMNVNGRYIRGYCVPNYKGYAEELSNKKIDISALISCFDDEQAYQLLKKAYNYLQTNKVVDDSLIPELNEAIKAGITDGTHPLLPASRCEAAVMALRATKCISK